MNLVGSDKKDHAVSYSIVGYGMGNQPMYETWCICGWEHWDWSLNMPMKTYTDPQTVWLVRHIKELIGDGGLSI